MKVILLLTDITLLIVHVPTEIYSAKSTYNSKNSVLTCLAFTYACMCGHLYIAKWLYETNKDVATEELNMSHRFAEEAGHDDVIEWLSQFIIKPILFK